MAAVAAQFVSNRLERGALVALCLIAAQMLVVLASCHPEPLPMAARVAAR